MSGLSGAEVLVKNLEKQGVERVFTVPGAKIDRLLEALRVSSIDIILCRSEMTASFMAAGHGRRTGKAGVVLVTSGPGVANLSTGLVTATCEGDPVLALGGAVPLSSRLKRTHQSMDNVSLLKPVTKYSVEIDSPDAIGEVIANAFRNAEGCGRPGASFVSVPMDLMMNECPVEHILCPVQPPKLGRGDMDAIHAASTALNAAKNPVILSGSLASEVHAASALRVLLASHPIPVVSTFQGTGTVPRQLSWLYCGRVGIIKNQPADKLLDDADVILAVGYDVIEYDAALWHTNGDKTIIHLDATPFDADNDYMPTIEITGSIADNLRALAERLSVDPSISAEDHPHLTASKDERAGFVQSLGEKHSPPGLVHPLKIVHDMQRLVDEDFGNNVTYFVDMGSFHIWIARHLIVHRPRQLVITNGQQTLGVSLPWAISAAFDAKKKGTDTKEKIISVSGDGGFMFCCAELETAVRHKLDLVHIIFDDTSFNMVKIQQEKKYAGHSCAVDFGHVDFVKLAESLGAHGHKVEQYEDLYPTLLKALDTPGPSLVWIPVDYSDNPALFATAVDRYH